MAVEFKREEIIPEAYRDKPYLKEVDSFDKLFATLDGAQTLLGKRPAGIPQDNAPEEEFKTFYSTIKPKDMTEYEIPETEFSKKVGRTDEAKAVIKGLLHKADISKYQAKKLIPELDTVLASFSQQQDEAKQAAKAAEDKKFDDTLTGLYADKRPQVVERAMTLLKKNLPDSLKPHLENMSTETLLLMTALSESIHQKYITSDTLDLNKGGGAGGVTVEGLNAEMQKIMATPAYKDFRVAGHDEARAKVSALSEQVAKILTSKK